MIDINSLRSGGQLRITTTTARFMQGEFVIFVGVDKEGWLYVYREDVKGNAYGYVEPQHVDMINY